MDALLEDFFDTGKDELRASAAKSKGRPKGYNSDEEDKQVTEKEISFCKFVDEVEEKVIVKQTICLCRFRFCFFFKHISYCN